MAFGASDYFYTYFFFFFWIRRWKHRKLISMFYRVANEDLITSVQQRYLAFILLHLKGFLFERTFLMMSMF